jgi:hypothetical protein
VSATTTQFRTALQALLAEEFAIPFVGGELEAPQEDKAIGCVWHEGKRWWPRDGQGAMAFYRIRIFPIFAVPQGTTTPTPRIEVLETWEERLEVTLAPVLVSLAAANGHWMFVVDEVGIDYPGQFVHGTIRAWQQNLSGLGG